jgi:hypothetical protein
MDGEGYPIEAPADKIVARHWFCRPGADTELAKKSPGF